MADKNSPSREAGIVEKFVDQGDGTHALGVTIVGLDTPVELTGDVGVGVLGATDDAAQTDPNAADATIASLTRGMLALLASVVGSASLTDALKVVLLNENSGQEINPATEGTLDSIRASIGAASDNAGDPTVIGLLKQIAANTAP